MVKKGQNQQETQKGAKNQYKMLAKFALAQNSCYSLTPNFQKMYRHAVPGLQNIPPNTDSTVKRFAVTFRYLKWYAQRMTRNSKNVSGIFDQSHDEFQNSQKSNINNNLSISKTTVKEYVLDEIPPQPQICVLMDQGNQIWF